MSHPRASSRGLELPRGRDDPHRSLGLHHADRFPLHGILGMPPCCIVSMFQCLYSSATLRRTCATKYLAFALTSTLQFLFQLASVDKPEDDAAKKLYGLEGHSQSVSDNEKAALSWPGHCVLPLECAI
jgi:hypothetical protein